MASRDAREILRFGSEQVYKGYARRNNKLLDRRSIGCRLVDALGPTEPTMLEYAASRFLLYFAISMIGVLIGWAFNKMKS